MYQVLYRMWRPARFADVIGQDAIITTLRRQVAQQRIAHAYLFSGTRGTGKTTTARILARAVNCAAPQDGEACNACEVCQALRDGRGMDVLELDAASNNGVDEIRDLRDKVRFPPAAGRFRVIIIDEAHMLSGGAFNALLKTLEEPPEHVVFILCTTEPQRLPATILSRCQRFDFARVPAETVARLMGDICQSLGVAFEHPGLMLIAHAGGGSVRDALSLLDVALGFAPPGETLTAALIREALGAPDEDLLTALLTCLLSADGGGALSLADGWLRAGRDAAVLLRELAGFTRAVVVAAQTPQAANILEVTDDEAQSLAALARRAPVAAWLRWLELFSRAEGDMRYAGQPRILLELCLSRAAHPESVADAPLEERLQRLEALYARGLPAAPPQAVPQTAPQAAPGAMPPPQAIFPPNPAPIAAPAQPAKPVAAPKRSAAPAPSDTPAPADADALLAGLTERIRGNALTAGLSVFLKKVSSAAYEDGTLTLRFDQVEDTAHGVLSRDQNHAALESALHDLAGPEATLVLSLGADAAPAPTRVQHSLLDQAADIFGRGLIVVQSDD